MRPDRRPAALLTSVCVGRGRSSEWAGRLRRTAIDKQVVEGPVAVDVDGLRGDEQVDRQHHGGPDQALYAYAQSDADLWTATLGRDLPAGSFGENLRVDGLAVSDALVGERWRIGDQVDVLVTAPRIPCRIFAGFLDIPDLVPRFIEAGRPGAYLRVLSTGTITAGDAIEVLDRPDHGPSVAEVMRIRTGGPAFTSRLVDGGGVTVPRGGVRRPG